MRHSSFLLVWALAALAAASAPAQAVAIQLAPSRDNTLYEDVTGGLSNGSGQYLFVGVAGIGGVRRAVLAFDVAAAIPAFARIVDVELRLVSSRSSATAPEGVDLHRVVTAWGEAGSIAPGGEGGGGPAQTGDATWLHGSFPAGLWNTPGGDFAAVPSSHTDLPVLGPFTFPGTSAMIDDVQAWLDGRAPNHGWLVKILEPGGGAARRLDSRNNTTGGTVPRLTVTYLPPGATQSFGGGCLTSAAQPFAQAVGGQVLRGQSFTLDLQNGIPLGLVGTLAAFGMLPDPVVLAPGCEVWLPPGAVPVFGLRGLDATGARSDAIAIPAHPSLLGLGLALQSVVLDLALARGYAVSPAHLICIG